MKTAGCGTQDVVIQKLLCLVLDSGSYALIAEEPNQKAHMISRNIRKGAFGVIGHSILNKGLFCLSDGRLQPKVDQPRPGNGCSPMIVSLEAKPMQFSG